MQAQIILKFNILKGDFNRGILLFWKGNSSCECCAHILNLIVKDSLKDLDDAIFRIHSVVKYVRSSFTRLQRFKNCAEQEKLEISVWYV